ncbi:adenosylcobalamin-dependent ribonucleoside-diphosphate reductase [Bacillus sp. CLL-7-23]|uniref:Vitamin B12-dependent ribonucleotide reductase n=1 Tax=Bacillus changyiensis TaxID=3004103 RepID=A0ABT4X3I9_9BACI|nr:adenosylcobalamin-dependent ribonucleoside-diphosphate reductase [Bacillus changyiensis]MDA7026848.1 adenosylcobalamin-dependent ribonucleoside-diphosphate reductase [Bacillus changyiensis]
MAIKLNGFQRKIHHARYARKARNKELYLTQGQPVVVLTKDGKYPVRELGKIEYILRDGAAVKVAVRLDTGDYAETQPGDIFIQDLYNVDILLETEYEETADRVAKAVASVDKLSLQESIYKKFKTAIENFYLVPSGRILTGAGDDSKVTLFNCYVIDVLKSPAAPEKGADSRHAIFYHMARISEIMAHGGGVGTNLTVFRPRYSTLSKTKGRSTGAVFIGNMFSGLTDFIEQGNRRGAQMLTLHDFHPDVFYTNDVNDPSYNEDFIGAKRKPGFMEGNNSSVLISDEFMHAVEHNLNWDLKFPDTNHPDYDNDWDGDLNKWTTRHGEGSVIVHRTIKARDMWDKLQNANHSSAEPGILFITKINHYHNGRYLGTVKATNPCGEQPILGNSTCNLSAVNLGRMIKVIDRDDEGDVYGIDWELLEDTIRTGVRFLDNVIDLTSYFDKDMEEWQTAERRLGLGVLGLHDLLIALRVQYGAKDGNQVIEEVMRFMRNISYDESIQLAKEKGAFPLYDEKGFFTSKFVQELPLKIQEKVRKYGTRNLTLLTIAPTGTTGSMTPSLLDPEGSVSTGVEPHFAMKYDRKSRIGETVQYAGVAKAYMDRNLGRQLPHYFVGAMDLSPEAHVNVQAIAQKYVCSSISKTINAPNEYTVEQVKKAYELGHKLGLKGMTIYRDGSRDEQILSVSTEHDTESQPESTNPLSSTTVKSNGKYEDWKCENCGSKDFEMVEGCPKCTNCGSQSCSF